MRTLLHSCLRSLQLAEASPCSMRHVGLISALQGICSSTAAASSGSSNSPSSDTVGKPEPELPLDRQHVHRRIVRRRPPLQSSQQQPAAASNGINPGGPSPGQTSNGSSGSSGSRGNIELTAQQVSNTVWAARVLRRARVGWLPEDQSLPAAATLAAAAASTAGLGYPAARHTRQKSSHAEFAEAAAAEEPDADATPNQQQQQQPWQQHNPQQQQQQQYRPPFMYQLVPKPDYGVDNTHPDHQQQQQQQPDPLLQQQWQQQQQQFQQQQQQQSPAPLPMPIYAVHLGAEVDYQQFCRDHNFGSSIKSTPLMRDHVVLPIDDLSEDVVLVGPGRQEASEEQSQCMVIYRYGSVVFFNVKARSRDVWLSRLRPYVKAAERDSSSSRAAPSPAVGDLRQDESMVVVRPEQGPWSKLEPDSIVVQKLDVGNIRVISHVLGQSVALDYYNSKVDEAIRHFSPYLCEVATSGKAHTLKEGRLLQLIADNSLLYTDVVTKIGLLDISQTAWTQDKYHDLWQSLRVDYELDRRFDAINRKLGPMLENAKFLLDIRAEKNSERAEAIIIGLIMFEVIISLTHFVM